MVVQFIPLAWELLEVVGMLAIIVLYYILLSKKESRKNK